MTVDTCNASETARQTAHRSYRATLHVLGGTISVDGGEAEQYENAYMHKHSADLMRRVEKVYKLAEWNDHDVAMDATCAS